MCTFFLLSLHLMNVYFIRFFFLSLLFFLSHRKIYRLNIGLGARCMTVAYLKMKINGILQKRQRKTNGNATTDFVLVFVLPLSMVHCSPRQIAYHEYSNMGNNQPNDHPSLVHDRSLSSAPHSLQCR